MLLQKGSPTKVYPQKDLAKKKLLAKIRRISSLSIFFRGRITVGQYIIVNIKYTKTK